jgi:hypothetical protein
MPPLELALTILLCAVVLCAPRRVALLALFAAIFFLNQRGGIQVGGLRVHAGRFMELAGIIRILARREFLAAQFTQLDRVVVFAYAYTTLAFLVRTMAGYGSASTVTMATPTSKIGDLVDIFLTYFTFRGLVKDLDDVRSLLKGCVWLMLPLCASLLVERITFRNPLAVLGGIPTVWIDDVDGGRIRVYGASSHPSLLGTVGAWFAILYVPLVLSKATRGLGILGFCLGITIVLLANSGGPLTCLMLGMLGWGCWRVRDRMQLVRRGIVTFLVLLAIYMKDPIWYLPSKMSIVFGGSGWHRSYLMDQAIRHANEWWLAGMPLDLTAVWFPYLVKGAADITNLYVAFGVDGGLVALLLLILLIVVAFRTVGQSMRAETSGEVGADENRLLIWGLGCGVLVHVVNYLSITYFDQTNALWLFQVAAVAALMSSTAEETASSESRSTVGAIAPYPAGARAGRLRGRALTRTRK